MIEFKQELLPLLPNLRAFARSLCRNGDWADDLVQDTIVRAWASRATYKPGTNIKAWLFTILRNHFYNELRKKMRSVELSNDQAALVVGVPEVQSMHLHMRDVVNGFEELSEDQRDALVLVGVAGYSYDESAKLSKCAVGTIKSRVARARRTLEDRFGGSEMGVMPAVHARSSHDLMRAAT